MKSIHHSKAGANAKLKGRKTAQLTCRCCMLINFKHEERVKEAKTEIRRYQNGLD
jgi:hypothetical protein